MTKLDKELDKALLTATHLHNNGISIAICEYCNKPLKKAANDVAAVFNLINNKMEYSHDECWEANNKVGTIEDLERMRDSEK